MKGDLDTASASSPVNTPILTVVASYDGGSESECELEEELRRVVSAMCRYVHKFGCPWMHWVDHLLPNLGLVDFDFCVPPSCPLAQPLLPHQLRWNWADSGTLKIQVYPTQTREQMVHLASLF